MKKRKGVIVLCIILCCMVLPMNVMAANGTGKNKSASLKINKKEATLFLNQSVKLKINGAKAKKVRWSSSDKKVATVSKKGVVTAHKKGKTTITARVNGRKLKCKVTVKVKTVDVTKKLSKDKTLKDFFVSECFMRAGNYDCTDRYKTEILMRCLVSVHYCENWMNNRYPVEAARAPVYVDDGCQCIIPEKRLKWIAAKIFNISGKNYKRFKASILDGTGNSKKHLSQLRKGIDFNGALGSYLSDYETITYNKKDKTYCYHYLPGEGIGINEFKLIKAVKKGKKYYIHYRWIDVPLGQKYGAPGTETGEGYAVMSKKKINGKTYWSLYSNGQKGYVK